MESDKAKALLEEVEHLLPDRELGYRQVQENLVRLGGITNTNYKLFNLFIRIPRTNLNPFFNRRAESYNLSLLSKEDLTEAEIYKRLVETSDSEAKMSGFWAVPLPTADEPKPAPNKKYTTK